MLFIRLLAIFLVLITNTWLLSPVRSDALRRYKRSLAGWADRDLSRLAGEPCTVSGPSLRQPRALSPVQHRPPAAHSRTSTSRIAPSAALEVCAGGCGFDPGLRLVPSAGKSKTTRGDTGDVEGRGRGRLAALLGRFYEKTDQKSEKESNYVATKQPGRSAPDDTERRRVSRGRRRSPRHPRARFPRSLGAKRRSEEKGNSGWEKVSSASPTHSFTRRRRDFHQGDGDNNQSSPGTPEDAPDYSGEVEEADAQVSSSVNGWGSPVPRVPPSWMTALYFSGHREHLKVKLAEGVELPRARFSLELWVKPEGGQTNPAVIAGGSN